MKTLDMAPDQGNSNPGNSLDDMIRQAQRSENSRQSPMSDSQRSQSASGLESSDALSREAIEQLRGALSAEDLKSLENLVQQIQQFDRNSSGQNSPSKQSGIRQSSRAPKPQEVAKNNQSHSLDVKQELQSEGFGPTLKRIVEQSKREVQANQQKQNNGLTGQSARKAGEAVKGMFPNDEEVSKSIAKAIDGIRKDAIDIAKDAKFKDPSKPWSPEMRNGSSSSNANSGISSWNKSASDFFKGMTKAPSANAPSSSPALNPQLPSLPSNLSMDLRWLEILLGVAVLSAVAIWWFRRKPQSSRRTAATEELKLLIEQSDSIRTRQDVIRAFHRLAMKLSQSVEPWWTHRRVELSTRDDLPAVRTAMSVLADVYEEARYLPEHLELSSTQLIAMRDALRQCAV